MEYLPFFVGFDEVITAVELIFDDRLAVFSSETLGITLFSLFWVHIPNDLLPFSNRVALSSLSIDQDHDTALSTHHIREYIFKVRLVLVLVVQIDDLLFE